MSQCTPTAMAKEPERERAHSSCSTAEVSTSAPDPPYCSSYSTPSSPSAPMRGQIQRGIRPAASHSSMCGAISFSTKLRTVPRNISCCSLKIFIALCPPSLSFFFVHVFYGCLPPTPHPPPPPPLLPFSPARPPPHPPRFAAARR